MDLKIYSNIAGYLAKNFILISAPFVMTLFVVKPVVSWNQQVYNEIIALDSDKDGITNIYDVTPYITLLRASVAPDICFGYYGDCEACQEDACSSTNCTGYDENICGGSCVSDACSSPDCPGYDANVCAGGCESDACSSESCPGYDPNVCG